MAALNKAKRARNGNRPAFLRWLYQRFLSIPVQEATFSRRGFRPCAPLKQARLERSGQSFLQGYHAALAAPDLAELVARLEEVEAEFRGFAFEGAAMGLALLDRLMPGRQGRLRDFLAGPGAAHIYMIHVGIGWAVARLPFYWQPDLTALDPLLRWLVIDGYGFHEGYFHVRRTVKEQIIPRRLSGYARQVFDQGLGRSLWFTEGADVARLTEVVSAFPPFRRSDLWSGIGLACAYAGSLDEYELLRLRIAAGEYAAHLAQGVAFAAKTRQRAGNPTAHTEAACEILCGMSFEAAAAVTDLALIER